MKNKAKNMKGIKKQTQMIVRTGIKSGVNFCESIDTCRQYCAEQGYSYDKSEYDCRCECYP